MKTRWKLRHLYRLLLVSLLVVSSAVAATPLLGAQGSGSIELVAQSPWVDDGAIFNLQVRIAGAPRDSLVGLRVYEPWQDRDAFLSRNIDDASVLLELEPVVLDTAQQGSNEVLGLELLVDGPNTPTVEEPTGDDDSDTQLQQSTIPVLETNGGSAVYPVEVVLLDSDGVAIDAILTSLIELPLRDLRPPLAVSMILAAQHEPLALAEQEQPDGPEANDLSTLASIVSQHPGANVGLVLAPEALISLADDESDEAALTLETLSAGLTPEQILPTPFADVEEEAWIEAGLGSELAELYDAGSAAIEEALGIAPDPSVVFLDRTISNSSLDEIVERGVQGVIASSDHLDRLDPELFPETLTSRFLLNFEDRNPATQSLELPALSTDFALSSHFEQTDGAVLNANRLLADLTLLSFQETGGRQSVVINPPDEWQIDPNFLNVVLSGIERIPVLAATTPIEALANTSTAPNLGVGTISGPLRRDLTPPQRATSLNDFRNEYTQARNAIDSWATVIGSDNSARAELDELLFRSADQRLTEEQRDGFLEAVFTEIDDQKDTAITAPQSETITLTGRESLVPIVVENNLDSEATVLMLLSSEELDFDESSEIVRSLQPGSNRIEIPITARASGDSPIRIQVLSPDRLILLGSAEVLVRTFAFSGLGIAIGSISIIVLLVWWVRHDRRGQGKFETSSDMLGA